MPDTAPAIGSHENNIDKCKGIFMSYSTFWRLVTVGLTSGALLIASAYAWMDTRYCSVNDRQDAAIHRIELSVAELTSMREDLRQMLLAQKNVNAQLLELMVRMRRESR